MLYHNYHVGDCPDLCFGVALVDYATSRNLPEGETPKIVQLCIAEIEKRGLDTEGIYRVRTGTLGSCCDSDSVSFAARSRDDMQLCKSSFTRSNGMSARSSSIPKLTTSTASRLS